MPITMLTAAAASERRALPKCAFFRPPILLQLGVACLSFYGALGEEDFANSVQPHGNIRHGNGNSTGNNYRSSLRDMHDGGAALEPMVLVPGEHSAGSLAVTAQHRQKKFALTEEGSQAVSTRRRVEENESLDITRETLKKLQIVVVLQDEGIVYCPIPKVASSEWERAFRWMVGIDDWEGTRSNLHKIVSNGLERLTDRGLEETRWALESDRYFKFVVVRDPAERLVSGFLNKCVKEGYEGSSVASQGAQNCPYLVLMPELFPDTPKASLATHARFKELTEADPEDVFFRFASGIYREAERHEGNTCRILNIHYRPQSCFCDLMNLLPAFHVMPFVNLSAEAEALAGRLPAALPESGVGLEVELEARGAEGMTASGRVTGVNETRREEIHQFLIQRFTEYHKVDPKGATGAADSKAKFLSERVLELVHKIFAQDYELFAEYL